MQTTMYVYILTENDITLWCFEVLTNTTVIAPVTVKCKSFINRISENNENNRWNLVYIVMIGFYMYCKIFIQIIDIKSFFHVPE